MKDRNKSTVVREQSRAVMITATVVLAIAMNETLMPNWTTVAEYASFTGVSKTSARASLKLAVDCGMLLCHKTGIKSFFYEPAHPHLQELVKACRRNERLQEKIASVYMPELPF